MYKRSASRFSAARTNQKGCLPRLSLSTLDMEVGKGGGTWTGMDWRILDRTIAWLYSCHWHAWCFKPAKILLCLALSFHYSKVRSQIYCNVLCCHKLCWTFRMRCEIYRTPLSEKQQILKGHVQVQYQVPSNRVRIMSKCQDGTKSSTSLGTAGRHLAAACCTINSNGLCVRCNRRITLQDRTYRGSSCRPTYTQDFNLKVALEALV